MTPAEETALGMVIRGILSANGVELVRWPLPPGTEDSWKVLHSDDFKRCWQDLPSELQQHWKSLTRLLRMAAQSLPAPQGESTIETELRAIGDRLGWAPSAHLGNVLAYLVTIAKEAGKLT